MAQKKAKGAAKPQTYAPAQAQSKPTTVTTAPEAADGAQEKVFIPFKPLKREGNGQLTEAQIKAVAAYVYSLSHPAKP